MLPAQDSVFLEVCEKITASTQPPVASDTTMLFGRADDLFADGLHYLQDILHDWRCGSGRHGSRACGILAVNDRGKTCFAIFGKAMQGDDTTCFRRRHVHRWQRPILKINPKRISPATSQFDFAQRYFVPLLAIHKGKEFVGTTRANGHDALGLRPRHAANPDQNKQPVFHRQTAELITRPFNLIDGQSRFPKN